jgi:hypothetical protein
VNQQAVEQGEKDVRALVDVLAAGEDAAGSEFGRLLLARFGPDTRPVLAGLTDADRLAEILHSLLEAELEGALGQFQLLEISRQETNRLTARFWGALSLHAELFLRHAASRT